MKKGYLYKANFILSIAQLFFISSFLFSTIIIFTFPNDKYGFTTNIDAWFETNWSTGKTNSFSELFAANGWIIIYQTVVVTALWSLIFSLFIEFIILQNYSKIAICKHTNKSQKNSNSKCSFCLEKEILGLKNSKKMILASVFGFAMIFFWSNSCKKLGYCNEINKAFLKSTQDCSINNKHFFKSLVNWKRINYNTLLTGLLYLLLVSTFLGLIMMWISYFFRFPIFFEELKSYDPSKPESILWDSFSRLSPLTSVLTYFTQFTNISCFIFTVFILIKPRANFFKNNTAIIFLSSYIIIVGIIYWTFLHGINFSIEQNLPESTKNYVTFNFATTLILHASTPILFTIFALALISYNGIKPRKYWSLWGKYIIYPLIYASFMYSLPFFTKIVVYGPITNLNPLHTNEISTDIIGDVKFSITGNPYYIFFSFSMILIFALFLLFFWGYAQLIHYLQNSKSRKALIWLKNPCAIDNNLKKEC